MRMAPPLALTQVMFSFSTGKLLMSLFWLLCFPLLLPQMLPGLSTANFLPLMHPAGRGPSLLGRSLRALQKPRGLRETSVGLTLAWMDPTVRLWRLQVKMPERMTSQLSLLSPRWIFPLILLKSVEELQEPLHVLLLGVTQSCLPLSFPTHLIMTCVTWKLLNGFAICYNPRGFEVSCLSPFAQPFLQLPILACGPMLSRRDFAWLKRRLLPETWLPFAVCFLRGSPLFAMFLACWSSLDFRKLPGCQFGGFCGTSRILVRQLLRHVNLAAHIARSSDFFSGRLRPRLWNVGVQVVMLTFPFRGATKASAVYVPELAKHFARAFASALDRDFRADAEGPRISGVESVVANDFLLSGSWREVLQWH